MKPLRVVVVGVALVALLLGAVYVIRLVSSPDEPLTQPQARALYLEATTPFNVALGDARELLQASRYTEPCGILATANERHLQELDAVAWPADLQPLVDERSELMREELAWQQPCADADNDLEARALLGEQSQADTQARGNRISELNKAILVKLDITPSGGAPEAN